MKLIDKIKNMFTEEVEEPVIKKEVMHVEIDVPKPEKKEEKEEITVVEPVKEEKPAPIFFDDEDFDALEKPKVEKVEKIEEEKTSFKDVYKTKKQIEEQKPKTFKPSPIISPVYGVLDKNYKVDDIEQKKVIPTTVYYENKELTIDDIRKKAYGTLEDDIETTLFGEAYQTPMHEKKEDVISNLLEDEYTLEEEKETMKNNGLEDFDDYEIEDNTDYKEEITDNTSEKTLEDDFDLSNDIMNSYEENEQDNDESISDSDLFDLIDSMYEEGEK